MNVLDEEGPAPIQYDKRCRLQGMVDSYDLDGEGKDWPTALRAYAADCKRAAVAYRELVVELEAEEVLFLRLAHEAERKVTP